MNRKFMIAFFMFALSCAEEKGRGPELLFNPFYEDNFYSFPFPSDFRKKEDDHLDMRGYPLPLEIYPLGEYPKYAEKALKGFGTNSPVYFTFTDAIDTNTLPQSPDETLAKDSSVMIINIDPECGSYGMRTPLIWKFQEDDNKYINKNTLMIAPMWGFPLEGGCTYAVMGTTDIKDKEGKSLTRNPLFAKVMDEIETTDSVIIKLKNVYKPLVLFLKKNKALRIDKIAFATVFTTQNPVDELVRIRNYFKTNFEPELLEINHVSSGDTDNYYYFEGEYTSPNLQYGEPPYMEEGGQFIFNDTGEPVIQRVENLRFALTVPQLTQTPTGGYPIVMYAHGTGGDYKSFIRDVTATNLTMRGLAVIGIDQPLHGPRSPAGTDLELASFNFFNPDAGRTNFRQSVVDSLILTKLIKTGKLFIPDSITPISGDIYFNPDKILFMGHSHGGLTGAMFISLTDDVRSAVLSGAGGGLSLTILERKDPDLNSIYRSLLGISPDEELTTFHPGIGLAQMLVEITDPINYAPYYFNKLLTFRSRNILMTEGMLDPYTPPSTAEAMARAGGIPLIEPVAHFPDSYALFGFAPHIPPVSENLLSISGERVTAGLLQFPEDGHYAVFNNPIAKEKYGEFLRSSAYSVNVTIP